MPAAKGRAWKLERASVRRKGIKRAHSNKYSGGDKEPLPEPGSRTRVWVGGYQRKDGIAVAGHYRKTPTNA